MEKITPFFKVLTLLLMLISSNSTAMAQDELPVQAYMTNAAIFVKDMEASLTFYTEYMGLISRSDSAITAGKSKDTLGIDQDIDTRIIYLAQNRSLRSREVLQADLR